MQMDRKTRDKIQQEKLRDSEAQTDLTVKLKPDELRKQSSQKEQPGRLQQLLLQRHC